MCGRPRSLRILLAEDNEINQKLDPKMLEASKALKKKDQVYGQKLAEMARKHSSESFYPLDDPLEAAVFSALVEIMKELSDRKVG